MANADTTPGTPAAATDPDLSGRSLGDYRLLRRLGSGAMAEVYLAEQTSLRRQVAIKVLKKQLASDETYVKRFQNEAQAAAALVHANIVQIHEVGHLDGIRYIAQEYVQGQNLREFMTRHGSPDLRLALGIMRQVGSALQKAADEGIVHRDIKPENIMLARSGEVKVADFGLARLVSNASSLNLTQIGITMGTPLYMSPEQVEGKPLDPRSDIYSFGVTCYHMLAGEPPFRGDTALSVAVHHLKTQPERLENRRPDLPPALCRIVHRMLAKDPADRYATARQMLRELHELHELHVEGLQDDWPDNLQIGGEDGSDALIAERCAATQQLGAIMRTTAMTVPKKPRRGLLVAGIVIALVAGAWAAAVAQKPYLLADVQAHPAAIPHADSALRQYFYASRIGTEDAWKSVITYFPDKERWVLRAKQQLARIYLTENRYDEALKLFREFENLGDSEKELRVFGMAGECGVLTRTGRYQESADLLQRLWPDRAALKDRQMILLLEHVEKKNREALMPASTPKGWASWLEEQFGKEN